MKKLINRMRRRYVKKWNDRYSAERLAYQGLHQAWLNGCFLFLYCLKQRMLPPIQRGIWRNKPTDRPLEKRSAAKRYQIKSHFFFTEENDNLNSFLYLTICIKETKILEHSKKRHMASKQSTIATETASLKS